MKSTTSDVLRRFDVLIHTISLVKTASLAWISSIASALATAACITSFGNSSPESSE